jgi:hypothetical protein
MLYIIQAEPIACAIRNTPAIHGIKLPDWEGSKNMNVRRRHATLKQKLRIC